MSFRSISVNPIFDMDDADIHTLFFCSFAYDEMHMLTAVIATRFDFELYETTWERDLNYVRDCFVGAVDASSKGIRIKVVGDNKRILF